MQWSSRKLSAKHLNEKPVIKITLLIKKFQQQGEKSGWSYLEIPQEVADQLNPGIRKSYRVKGKLASLEIRQTALLPMGDGRFILPFNQSMRKATGKRQGEKITAELEADNSPLTPPEDFIACLRDEPFAWKYFHELTKGHQNYFTKWIESAKTIETKAKRIALAISALQRRMDFGAMLRESKKQKAEFFR
jgi:hypothetical protein